MASSSPSSLRSLYRSLLRELPPRPLLRTPRSPLHTRIRSQFTPPAPPSSSGSNRSRGAEHAARSAGQLVAYLRSQRTYVALVERYNPGMDMSQDERIRLTARRVGMDLPLVGKK